MASEGPALPHVLAVDVGGTTIKGAIVATPLSRRILDPISHLESPTRSDDATPIRAVLDFVARMLDRAHQSGVAVTSVGIAAPGVVDAEHGIVRNAANLGWHDLPLADLVSARCGLPTAVTNNAHAAALAEHQFGAAEGVHDFVAIPIGTGVGGAVMSGGRFVRGWHGSPGEVGHLVVVPGGAPCSCGQRGCVEAYASGVGLSNRYFEATGRRITAEELAGAIDSDDDAARIWVEGIDALGFAVAGVISTIDPEIVVIGGSVANSGDRLVVPLRSAVRSRLSWRQLPRIATSPLGSTAARIGAAIVGAEVDTAEVDGLPSTSYSGA